MGRFCIGIVTGLVLLAAGCGDDGSVPVSPDPIDGSGVAGGKADGGAFSACELDQVVLFLNAGPTAEDLIDAGVHSVAATNLEAHRDGTDGAYPTEDDDRFDDIEEVDGVDYVGENAMRQLVAVVEPGCTARPEACADAPLLGSPGFAQRQSFDTAFAWSDGWAVGEPVTVAVPEDIEGLVVAVVAGEVDTGVNRVLFDGETLLDIERDDPMLEGIVPPFFHSLLPAAAIKFPMDEESSLGAGCLEITPVALDEIETGTVTFVSRRMERGGAIDINAVVVGGTGIGDRELAQVFDVAAEVYMGAGDLTIGDVRTVQLDWPDDYVEDEGPTINALRAALTTPDEGRLNVFFVQDFLEVGTLGFASAIPGPNGIHGTAGSGLVISVDSHLDEAGAVDLTTMGETIAHEIGHQLGLFHTTEDSGMEHDILDDTPECGVVYDTDGDGELTAEECADHGARNVMFWVSGDLRQNELSGTQLDILSASPVVR
jgi:hypothetical protein